MSGKDWQGYKEKCGAFDFQFSLLVDSRIFLVAFPNEDAIAAGCAPLFFHANAGKIKEVAPLKDPEAVNTLKNEATFLHSFHFSEIAAAYEQVEMAAGKGSTDPQQW